MRNYCSALAQATGALPDDNLENESGDDDDDDDNGDDDDDEGVERGTRTGTEARSRIRLQPDSAPFAQVSSQLTQNHTPPLGRFRNDSSATSDEEDEVVDAERSRAVDEELQRESDAVASEDASTRESDDDHGGGQEDYETVDDGETQEEFETAVDALAVEAEGEDDAMTVDAVDESTSERQDGMGESEPESDVPESEAEFEEADTRLRPLLADSSVSLMPCEAGSEHLMLIPWLALQETPRPRGFEPESASQTNEEYGEETDAEEEEEEEQHSAEQVAQNLGVPITQEFRRKSLSSPAKFINDLTQDETL